MNIPALAPELKPLVQRTRVLWLIIAASLLYVTENAVTLPIPWLRLGISNVFVLVAARRLGFGRTMQVAWGKTVLGALATGQLLTPIFFINLSGATIAAVLTGTLGSLRALSLVGVSTVAAWGHVWGQLVAAGLLWGDIKPVLGLAPILLGMALVTGPLTGWLAEKVSTELG
jgi:heptaprenyl diphosphate synthase